MSQSPPSRLSRLLPRRIWSKLILLSILVGIVSGCGALVFNYLLTRSNDLFMIHGAGYVMPQAGSEGGTGNRTSPKRPWLLLILPAVGGLLSGVLVYTLAPEAEGHGTDAMVRAFHHNRGIIRRRVPIIKTIASAITIGSGGSAGREGPIAQIGAGFGSAVATSLGMSDRERRLLVLAGAGAGIGAIFRAPLGAALFSAEVLYRDAELESAAIVPGFIASIVGYSLYCGVTGVWGSIFTVPTLEFRHPLKLLLYLILGVVCALGAMLYTKFFYGIRDHLFRRIPLPKHFIPALGGLGVGVLGFFLPEVLGMGYGWAQMAIDGALSVRLAIAIALGKIVATGLTISSGGSGGVFGPSIVIGGLLGSAVGTVLHHFFPYVEPAAFALVGMAGFWAGAAKTPIAAVVMVCEMTMGYSLLVPVMLAAAVAYLLTPQRLSIYEEQVHSRVDSPAHADEFAQDVLGRIKVKDVLRSDAALHVFHPNTPLHDVLLAAANTRQQIFPIVGAGEGFLGLIDFQDIRLFLSQDAPSGPLLLAQDFLISEVATLSLDEDLASTLRKLQLSKFAELPVLAEGSGRVVGILGRRDIIAAYHQQMYALPAAIQAPAPPLSA